MHLFQTAKDSLASIASALLGVCITTSVAAAMSDTDRTKAIDVANTVSWVQPRAPLADAHPLQIQTLSIEKDEQKKNKQSQRARVYQFHYDIQQSRLVLIDLPTASVVSTHTIDSVHLPLNANEIAMARKLVEADQTIMQKMAKEYARRASVSLTDLSMIDVKASIFEPSNNAHICATQRCALLSLFDQTHTVFAVEPLVNLQRLSVTTLRNHP